MNPITFKGVWTPEESFVKNILSSINRRLYGEDFYLHIISRMSKHYTEKSIYDAACEALARINSGESPYSAGHNAFEILIVKAAAR